jgi:hypothetical protein
VGGSVRLSKRRRRNGMSACGDVEEEDPFALPCHLFMYLPK